MTEPTPVPENAGGVAAETVSRQNGPPDSGPSEPDPSPSVRQPKAGPFDVAEEQPAATTGDTDGSASTDSTAATGSNASTDSTADAHATAGAGVATGTEDGAHTHGTPTADGTAGADSTTNEEYAGDAQPATTALWQEFVRAPSQQVRDRLVLHYAPLVKYVAGRVGTGLPTHVDVADLIQSGIFGLVDAIEKFDPDRGLRFETYAMQRIRGAILDDLRSQDWVPRVVRSRARETERALDRLGARLRRTPTDAELAAELGISLDDLRDLYGQLRLTSVVALEDLVAAGREAERDTAPMADALPDDGAVDPVTVLIDQDNRRQLADAIAQLSERDRIVVSLYYFENLTLAEIGKVLGVTESRVSQLHTRAVLRLRAKLQGQGGA